MNPKVSYRNIILLCIAAVVGFIYFLKGGIILKALTSLFFVLIGVSSFFSSPKNGFRKPQSLILIGLIFCFLADIVLNFVFIIGALFFALGHIFYILAYSGLEKFNFRDLVISLSIALLSFVFLLLFDGFAFTDSVLKTVCYIYALIISFMLGKAISNVFSIKSNYSLLIMIGSILFFISDVALLFYLFLNASEFANTICLITYFPAQCIIALSIESIGNSTKNH